MRIVLILIPLLILVGCSGASSFKQGNKLYSVGDFDNAVVAFAEAMGKNPDKAEYQMRLQLARHSAALMHEVRGDEFFAAQDYQSAVREFHLALSLDGSLQSSQEGARQAGFYLEAEKLVADARTLIRDRHFKQAHRSVKDALEVVVDFQPALELKKELERRSATMIDGVELEVVSDEPITLNFKAANLPDVFDILTQLSGIRFILDDAIRTQTTTLYLEDATFAQAFELLLRMNKLDKKILNSKTIILFPNSKDKKKQFSDQVIQTFYLSNIDAKKAVNLLRTMLQVRKIYVHEELNAIVLRDTPAVVRLAQKIIEANDRATSEVVFDLELVEVSHTNDLNFGPKLSAYSMSVGLSDPANPSTSIENIVVGNLKHLDFLYSVPSVTFDLKKQATDAEILASPKIRVKNRGKAKVHIGSREPVVTVTVNTTQTSENVQYVDVGVKLDVEPIIQLDNTIVTKLGLEVSNVSAREKTDSGTVILTISTTNANTELILKDGVQTIIGGLLRDDDSKSRTGIPILSDIPFLGSLFTSYTKTKTKREILLSITPHIVRSVRLPEGNSATIWSGGEDDLRVGRNFGSFADEYIEGQGKTPNRVVPSLVKPKVQPQAQQLPLVKPSGSLPGLVNEKNLPEIPVPAVPLPVIKPAPKVLPERFPAAPPSRPVAALTPPPAPEVPEVLLPGLQVPEIITRPSIFIEGDRLVRIGSNFKLTLSVQDVEKLFSAPLYVRYDPKLVDFVGATEGVFFKQGGGPTIFTSTAMPDAGRVIVGLKQGVGGKGVSGGGVLATLEFKAKAAGKLSIAPERINFRNPAGERLPIDSRGLIIEVK